MYVPLDWQLGKHQSATAMNPERFCYNAGNSVSLLPRIVMNCTLCNTEIPNGAAFCPQCGSPITSKPIFSPEPQELSQTGQYNLLIGCACVLGALMTIAMLVGIAWFNAYYNGEGLRLGGSCCGSDRNVSTEQIKVGADFNLYGRTLDNEEFDWESLRGKYVLVMFTATWCPPCQEEIPGMLSAYEKYHDKGLEIVSVYIREDDSDAVATVKQFVEKEKLPWIILSEALTEMSGQPSQDETFEIYSVPTMFLVDKEGKVFATETRGIWLQQELQKLFDE